MTPLVTALSSLVSLMGLWYLLVWLLRDYRVDRFRQETFALRDAFFDEALAQRIDFNHPAYGLMRMLMNGFIRFGHRLTMAQVLLVDVLVPDALLRETSSLSFAARWDRATADLPGPARTMVEDYRLRLNIIVLQHLILSPVVFVTLAPFVAARLAKLYVARLLAAFKRPIQEIDTIAVTLGASA